VLPVIFTETPLPGAFLIAPEPRADHRGHFSRLWCMAELGKLGLDTRIAQINTGFSPRPGTLRGMHLQLAPNGEVKVVRCTRGAVFDVIVDLRRGSPTHAHWHGVELDAHNALQLYVPAGFAHGYLTLAPDSEVVYLASVPYAPQSATGVRFDDPAFRIDWPATPAVVSDADRSWPDYGDGSRLGAKS
jgi:dTDP-4-dehydrorhamnose 3,5-epimerase